ncbi:MAG: sulfotransferase [Rhizobiales bacterium]|nr:sulfotransferase [Hyphomicrobiales bacterium]
MASLALPLQPATQPRPVAAPEEGPLVDFCIIGVQKAGTTALHHFLGQHPLIQLSHEKEVHYFDAEQRLAAAGAGHAAYHAAFPPARPGTLTGESTPIYIFWPGALERLAAYNPAMRIIVLVRDPAERAHSHWRMSSGRGRDALSFPAAIREGRARLAEGGDFALRNWSYVERGFYGAQARRVLGLFPRRQVLFLRTEDLRERHMATLAGVFGFLGLPAIPVRPSLIFCDAGGGGQQEMTGEDRRHLRALYRGDLRDFAGLAGLDVTAWLG